MLRPILLAGAFLALLCLPWATDAEVVLSDDGREVRLNDDGSWTFVSNDRFATSDDGRRIRLKSDGSWETVEDDNRWVQSTNIPQREDRVKAEGIEVALSGWRIESERDRRKKNTTLRTQMVIELSVTGSDDLLGLSTRQLKVSDNRGRVYPVTHISRAEELADGVSRIRLIAEGAPRWFGTKFFRLELPAGALGLERGALLTKIMADVQEADVESLTEL